MNHRSIRRRVSGVIAGAACVALAGLLAGCADQQTPSSSSAPAVTASSSTDVEAPAEVAVVDTAPEPEKATEEVVKSTSTAETVTVDSCDGENKATVPKKATGKALAEALMAQWLRDHPEKDWVAKEKAAHAPKPPADNSDVVGTGQGESHAYGNYTAVDVLVWERETEKAVAEGSRIFHNADELGSTVAVSCDMCHPHTANTHTETYPKYQVQLGRVALLRDMINWCIENPVRGTKLDADSPTMRALEAYILSQRKGTPMNYGKH